MPLHAQYLVNLCEICTTKRSWKDLHTEGIKLNPLLYETWFTTPPTFGTFSLCNCRFKLISDNKQCIESCKFSYSLGVYPICMRNRKILHGFFFLILDTSQSNLRHPPSLLVWFTAHPRNYFSNGVSHGVYQFSAANLEKLGIYLGQERVKWRLPPGS